MSYKTTLENLTRDTQVQVDLHHNLKKSQSTLNQRKIASTTGVDVDNFKNRWVNGTVLEVRENTVLVQLDLSSKLRDEDEEQEEMMNQYGGGGEYGSGAVLSSSDGSSFSVEPESVSVVVCFLLWKIVFEILLKFVAVVQLFLLTKGCVGCFCPIGLGLTTKYVHNTWKKLVVVVTMMTTMY